MFVVVPPLSFLRFFFSIFLSKVFCRNLVFPILYAARGDPLVRYLPARADLYAGSLAAPLYNMARLLISYCIKARACLALWENKRKLFHFFSSILLSDFDFSYVGFDWGAYHVRYLPARADLYAGFSAAPLYNMARLLISNCIKARVRLPRSVNKGELWASSGQVLGKR